MKLISRAVAIYVAAGLLTFLLWEFYWLDTPITTGAWWDGPFSRGPVTVIFGPIIAITWPEQLASIFRIGGDWLPFHPWVADLVGGVFSINLAILWDDIVDDIRRLYRAL